MNRHKDNFNWFNCYIVAIEFGIFCSSNGILCPIYHNLYLPINIDKNNKSQININNSKIILTEMSISIDQIISILFEN